jgi:site-specific DNA-methyltransferase (cytosine-N4-specific)
MRLTNVSVRKNSIKARTANFLNKVFYKNSQNMFEIPDETVDLIITSPPYFNIKDYAKDGYQKNKNGNKHKDQLGDIGNYERFINELLKVWQECERVLKPNGKLIINTPLIPMKKAEYSTHYNRHIFDLNSDIQHSILHQNKTNMFLYDLYVWERTNPSKKLMFGSYPYPRNFYAQNTSEFITVYVKNGNPANNLPKKVKEASKLTEKEWIEYTKQIWRLPIPGKNDIAFGSHSALMPEEIVYRCVRLYTYIDDIVLDPFAGSGTTLKIAKETGRNYIGYELMTNYKTVIDKKLRLAEVKLKKNRAYGN